MRDFTLVRQRCFYGLLLTGGLSGIVEYHWLHQSIMYNFFSGLILLGTTAFLGSFTGFFIKNALRVFRGLKAYMGQSNDGSLIGALFGSLVAILGQALIGAHPYCALSACVGGFIGGMIGAFPDEIVPDILRLLHESESDLEFLEPYPEPIHEPLLLESWEEQLIISREQAS
ncbi:MAG: hypothetical protein V3573_11565 [Desulfovibrionaceae bacterium]